MLIALLPFALAAPGLELPATEDPRLWRSAAQLAGIEVGCGAGPCVRVEVISSTWELRVGTRHGAIAAPVDEQGRAAVAWLAASLAQPLPKVAVAPPPKPRPVAPRPPPAVPEVIPAPPIPPPAAVLVPVEPVEPPPPPPPAPSSAPAPPPPRLRPTVDLRVGGGATVQPGIDPAAIGVVGGTVGLGRWWVELGGELSTAAPLSSFDTTWTQARVEALAGVGYTPVPWLSVGVGGGASRRAWADEGVAVAETWVPVVDATVDARAPGPVVDIVLRLRPAVDLRGVQVARGGTPVGQLPPYSLSASVAAVFHVSGRGDR